MKTAAGLLLLGLIAMPLAAQTTTAPTPTAPTTTPATPAVPAPVPILKTTDAKPYSDDEFPDWALKLRRFEIIAVGAFPIAYLFSGLGYDYAYYVSAGYPQQFVPWPAGPGTSQWTTLTEHDKLNTKNYTLVGVAAGVSLLLAGIDWLLGQ